jgi:hypothetical protein
MDQSTILGAGAASVWGVVTLGASTALLGGEGGVLAVAAGVRPRDDGGDVLRRPDGESVSGAEIGRERSMRQFVSL